MKNLRKNKKFVLAASLGLVAVMVAAATFAWFSAQDSVDNKFKTGGIPDGSVKVWEIFEEPEEWKPGQEVNKDVAVANFGKEDIFVRASFSELITKLEAAGSQLKVYRTDMAIAAPGEIPVPAVDYASTAGWKVATESGFTTSGMPTGAILYVRKDTVGTVEKVSYAAVSDFGGKVSGTFELVGTVITCTDVKFDYYKELAPVEFNWTNTPPTNTLLSAVDPLIAIKYHSSVINATPTDGSWYYNAVDGWFYYVGTVAGGAVSPMLLDSVTLSKDSDNTYQYLNYKLTVNVEGLQATAEALSNWGITSGNLYDRLAAAVAP